MFDSAALATAARWGHVACVALLLPHSDAQAGDSKALRCAAGNGHTECVALLLPHCNAKDLHSCALQWAADGGHKDCVDLLWDVSDAEDAMQDLAHKHTQYPDDQHDHTIQWLQKYILQQAVGPALGCGRMTRKL